MEEKETLSALLDAYEGDSRLRAEDISGSADDSEISAVGVQAHRDRARKRAAARVIIFRIVFCSFRL